MNRRNMLLGGFALLGLGGWFATSGKGVNSSPVTPFIGAANAQTVDGDASAIEDMFIGNADSPVTMIEYASFTCPHCANFHEGVFKQLKADYIDTGKIKFVYREVYFDRPGLWASMVARCGGADKFFGIINMIYKSQSSWTRADSPAAMAAELTKIGRLAGLDSETLDACMKDGAKAEALIAWFEENRQADDITSTPSFLINGKKYSNMSYDEMKTLLDKALEG